MVRATLPAPASVSALPPLLAGTHLLLVLLRRRRRRLLIRLFRSSLSFSGGRSNPVAGGRQAVQ